MIEAIRRARQLISEEKYNEADAVLENIEKEQVELSEKTIKYYQAALEAHQKIIKKNRTKEKRYNYLLLNKIK